MRLSALCAARFETKNRFAFFHQIETIARNRFQISCVSLNQVHFARLPREVNLIKTDATYLETIARDRLDLMKEGETIFRLEARGAKRR